MKIKIKDANTHLKPASGYGQMALNIAAGLNNLKHDVYFDYITGSQDSLMEQLAKKKFEHTPETIYLWIRPPHYAGGEDFNPEHKNIFFTMHEKETFEGWKENWCELLNKCKAVITPTSWNADVFLNNGVKVPRYVVPLAVNTKVFSPFIEDSFGILTCHDALGSPRSREDWKETILAFTELFAGRKLAHFTIKTWNYKEADFAGFIKDFKEFDIRVVVASLHQNDMADLYRRHQLFVKNSNLEGWSIPMTEAMASGSVVAAFDNPVLRENAREYPVLWFKKRDQLKFYMDQEYKKWREKMATREVFAWKNSIEKLVEILKVYEK